MKRSAWEFQGWSEIVGYHVGHRQVLRVEKESGLTDFSLGGAGGQGIGLPQEATDRRKEDLE